MPSEEIESTMRKSGDTSEALVNLAIGLMRRVDERLERMETKWDKMDEERRKEAGVNGAYGARLQSVEQRLDTNDKVRVGLIVAVVGQFFYAVLNRAFK